MLGGDDDLQAALLLIAESGGWIGPGPGRLR